MIDDTDVTMLRSRWQSYLTSVERRPKGNSGVCYLPELALLRFTGRDAMTFLQGYLTSDAFALSEPKSLFLILPFPIWAMLFKQGK